jgi:hypothetical protein|tara:strand:+ start:109 stop:936 length:828 start_codon:yes stop_codon:yes gene_type:complete
MAFKETNTLINNESKVRIDVETLARVEFSDIEFLLDTINNGKKDPRLERILYESIISKVAAIFQLAMRAYEYLEKPDLKKDLINAFNKSKNTSTGKIGKYREDLFHSGVHFFEKTMFYPFGIFEGRGFKGIQIKKGAHLDIKNVWTFKSGNSEYSITSEGVYEIKNIGTNEEQWNLINEFPTISSVNYDDIIKVIDESVKELKIVWSNISTILNKGDGNHKYQFLNENGKWELLEKINGEIKSYKSDSQTINVTGVLRITPPDKLIIRGKTLTYE